MTNAKYVRETDNFTSDITLQDPPSSAEFFLRPFDRTDIECIPPPRAVWLLSCEIVYRVSLWTHTKTPPAFKFCQSLIPAVAAVGLMTKKSVSLRKALATA